LVVAPTSAATRRRAGASNSARSFFSAGVIASMTCSNRRRVPWAAPSLIAPVPWTKPVRPPSRRACLMLPAKAAGFQCGWRGVEAGFQVCPRRNEPAGSQQPLSAQGSMPAPGWAVFSFLRLQPPRQLTHSQCPGLLSAPLPPSCLAAWRPASP
jgi:hypothetical protein